MSQDMVHAWTGGRLACQSWASRGRQGIGQCVAHVSVQRARKWYCAAHDPERIAAAQQKRDHQRMLHNAVGEAKYELQRARDRAADMVERGGQTDAQLQRQRVIITRMRAALATATAAYAATLPRGKKR